MKFQKKAKENIKDLPGPSEEAKGAKKAYSPPGLTIHGTVEDITKGAAGPSVEKAPPGGSQIVG